MAARFAAEMVVAMLQEEPEEEDEEAICSGSESETSDDDDPDYLPQGQAEVVGVSGNPALLHEEDSSDDAEDSSDESSEEETQTQSNSCLWIRCKIPFTRPPWGLGDMKISAGSYGLTTRGPGLYKRTSDRRAKGRGRGARSAQFQKTEKPAAGVPSAPGLCARSTNT